MPSQYESLARGALAEITPAATIGAFVDETRVDETSADETGVDKTSSGESNGGGNAVSLRFANTQPGYRGWLWTVSIAHVEGEDPTVLEAELLPTDDALLAPEWVPWSERLAEYEASQGSPGTSDEDASGSESEDDDDPDDDDDVSDDESDDEDDDLDDDDDDDDDDLDDDDDVDLDDEDDDDALGSDVLHGGDLDGVDIDDLDADLDDVDDADDDADDDEPASLER